MGTSCASMNRTGKSNAKKGPEVDYNAFKDFIDRETEAHISRWMIFAGMADMKGIASSNLMNNEFINISWLTNPELKQETSTPTPFLLGSPSRRPIPDTSDWDLQMKREWLHKKTQVLLDEVFLRTSVPENVIMLEEAFKQGFTCREAECGMQFPLHSTRVRY